MKSFKIIAISFLVCLSLSGCITFGFQKNETGNYAWKEVGWQSIDGKIIPLAKLEF